MNIRGNDFFFFSKRKKHAYNYLTEVRKQLKCTKKTQHKLNENKNIISIVESNTEDIEHQNPRSEVEVDDDAVDPKGYLQASGSRICLPSTQ